MRRPTDYVKPRFDALLGPLHGGDPSVTAECLYVDPVADLAILKARDRQDCPEQAEAYAHFVEPCGALRLSGLRRRATAWMLALDGQWQPCRVEMGRGGRTLRLIDAQLVKGMSGSPIVDTRGRVIGVVSCADKLVEGVRSRGHCGQPVPLTNLPAWLLADLRPSPLAALPARMTAFHAAWAVSECRLLRKARATVTRLITNGQLPQPLALPGPHDKDRRS